MSGTGERDAARDFSAWAENWAELWSGYADPARQAVLEATEVGPGVRLLDVGCGSGELCRLASERGAAVSGADAAEGMLAIARRRAPDADLRLAPVERLPWRDAEFDVVTAFNVFQFAADIPAAIREAARVLRPGGRLAVCNWGPSQEQQLNAVTDALEALLPPPADAEGEPSAERPALGEPGVLEELLGAAGLEPVVAALVPIPYELPDQATAERAFLLDAGLLHLDEYADAETVRTTILTAAAPFRRPDGSYRFENELRYVVARR